MTPFALQITFGVGELVVAPAFMLVPFPCPLPRQHSHRFAKLGRRLVERLFHKGTMRLQAREVKR